jgi:hypothetical protein
MSEIPISPKSPLSWSPTDPTGRAASDSTRAWRRLAGNPGGGSGSGEHRARPRAARAAPTPSGWSAASGTAPSGRGSAAARSGHCTSSHRWGRCCRRRLAARPAPAACARSPARRLFPGRAAWATAASHCCCRRGASPGVLVSPGAASLAGRAVWTASHLQVCCRRRVSEASASGLASPSAACLLRSGPCGPAGHVHAWPRRGVGVGVGRACEHMPFAFRSTQLYTMGCSQWAFLQMIPLTAFNVCPDSRLTCSRLLQVSREPGHFGVWHCERLRRQQAPPFCVAPCLLRRGVA